MAKILVTRYRLDATAEIAANAITQRVSAWLVQALGYGPEIVQRRGFFSTELRTAERGSFAAVHIAVSIGLEPDDVARLTMPIDELPGWIYREVAPFVRQEILFEVAVRELPRAHCAGGTGQIQ